MTLFWERGYAGTSFDDLIAVMGISPSSFYNAFGSKESLYQEAVQAYAAHAGQWFTAALDAATDTRSAFRQVVTTLARELTRSDRPAGCMISLAGTHVHPSLDSVRAMMTDYRCAAEAAMAARIQRGIDEGDVPESTNVQSLAAFYSALARGMAVLARDGVGRERLLEIADIGMRAWPDTSREQSRSAAEATTAARPGRRASLG